MAFVIVGEVDGQAASGFNLAAGFLVVAVLIPEIVDMDKLVRTLRCGRLLRAPVAQNDDLIALRRGGGGGLAVLYLIFALYVRRVEDTASFRSGLVGNVHIAGAFLVLRIGIVLIGTVRILAVLAGPIRIGSIRIRSVHVRRIRIRGVLVGIVWIGIVLTGRGIAGIVRVGGFRVRGCLAGIVRSGLICVRSICARFVRIRIICIRIICIRVVCAGVILIRNGSEIDFDNILVFRLYRSYICATLNTVYNDLRNLISIDNFFNPFNSFKGYRQNRHRFRQCFGYMFGFDSIIIFIEAKFIPQNMRLFIVHLNCGAILHLGREFGIAGPVS